MAVHLAFNEIERFDTISDSSNVLNSTLATIVESGVNRAGFRVNLRASAEVNLPTPLSSGWFHCKIRTKNATAVGGQIVGNLINLSRGGTSADSLVALRSPGATGAQTQLLAVRVRSDADTDTTITSSSFVGDVDIHFVIAEEGLIRVYLDGILEYEFMGDTRFDSGDQAIDKLTFSNTGTAAVNDGTTTFYSQVIVADEPTINAKVYTLELSEGNTMDWDGTVADVVGMDPAAIGDELTSDEADEVALFSYSMPAIDEGANRIAEVFFSSIVFNEPETAPMDIDFVYYDGESTTEAEELKSVTEMPSTLTWQLSSHVGPLSVAALNALEFGVTTKET